MAYMASTGPVKSSAIHRGHSRPGSATVLPAQVRRRIFIAQFLAIQLSGRNQGRSISSGVLGKLKAEVNSTLFVPEPVILRVSGARQSLGT
ncbi:hypothetical protein [Bradyrhizobium sp. CB3481]|uniref:hypothetical protein n=1 Tax=Bradyrhizobium sp. CB3481 TaxID=3039158 RepID=UPI0024B06719|nr:hypothetical protein [Bradyrhizobium sp. CB3481]WFU18731.1 hypothetical protein QA643_10550 [Bradyrhizobium sp. CB3481]